MAETNTLFTNPLTKEAQPFTAGVYASVPISLKSLSAEPVTRAEQYPAPRVLPLAYPGVRPETSFTNGENGHVWPVAVETDPKTNEIRFFINTESGVWDLDDALERAGALKMDERIPVVTFGSNANPGQLLNKFKKLETSAEQQVVPTTKAVLHNATPVYVPKVGIWNYSFADLYPEQGAETEVFVNWLTPTQLEAMHKTEKAYTFCEYGTVALDGADAEIPAYLYASTVNVYLGEDEKPVRLANIRTEHSTLRALDQEGIQQELAGLTGSHLKDSFEHIQKEVGESEIVVDSLHRIIQTMPDYIGANNEAFKKGDIGNAMAEYLVDIGRAAPASLLSVIPVKNQNVDPLNFGEIKATKAVK